MKSMLMKSLAVPQQQLLSSDLKLSGHLQAHALSPMQQLFFSTTYWSKVTITCLKFLHLTSIHCTVHYCFFKFKNVPQVSHIILTPVKISKYQQIKWKVTAVTALSLKLWLYFTFFFIIVIIDYMHFYIIIYYCTLYTILLYFQYFYLVSFLV